MIPAVSNPLVHLTQPVTPEAEVEKVRHPVFGEKGHKAVASLKGDVVFQTVGVGHGQATEVLTGQCETAAVDGAEIFQDLKQDFVRQVKEWRCSGNDPPSLVATSKFDNLWNFSVDCSRGHRS